MKRRIKRTIIISSVVLVVSFGFIFGTRLFDFCNVRRTYLPFERLQTGIEESEKSDVLLEQKVSDIAIVDGITAIADDDGFSILNEMTGKETQITTDPASTVVFDGKIAFFVRTGIEDPSVVVRSGGGSNDAVEYVGGERHFWERCRVCSYDVSTNQVKELFDSNGFNTSIIFADKEYLYYTDYSDENVGWFVGESQHTAPTLFKYSLHNGKREIVSLYAAKIGTVGNTIFYTDAESSSYRHSTWFYGGDLHVYNTISHKDYLIDNEAEFLFAEKEAYIYVTVQDYDGFGDTCDCRIMRCGIDGEDKAELKQIHRALEQHYGQYLVFNNESPYKNDEHFVVYNALTDKSILSTRWYYELNDGELIGLDYDNPGEISTLTDSGEIAQLYDLSAQLPKGYAVTSIFDENGVYCKPIEGLTDNKYVPFK